MTVSTQGLEPQSGSRATRAAVELPSSMRFSISLLSVICIASVMGTVLKQQESANNYVNQLGPFWAEVFGAVSLYSVSSVWWFLLILAFIVISTSLCIARNTPKILYDFKTYKENIRIQSLQAFGHRVRADPEESPETAAQRIGQMLKGGGWKVKLQERGLTTGASADEVGWMVAAKVGAANKFGYIAAHSAIVLVCLGGLLNGDLVVRAQMAFNGKTAYSGGGMLADVKPEHRLSDRNPALRGHLTVTEGTPQSSTVIWAVYSGISVLIIGGILVGHRQIASRLPSFEILDDLMHKSIAVGFAFFTIAAMLGALWAADAWGGCWSWDPKKTWALIVWLNYAAWLHMRLMKGLRGTVAA